MPACFVFPCFGKRDSPQEGALGPGRMEYPMPVRLEELGERNPLLQSPQDPETHKKMLAITNPEDEAGIEPEGPGPASNKKSSPSKPLSRASSKNRPATAAASPFQLQAEVVTAHIPGVTVSGLQPVQIFEGSMFRPDEVANGGGTAGANGSAPNGSISSPAKRSNGGPQSGGSAGSGPRKSSRRGRSDKLRETRESNLPDDEDPEYVQRLEEATEMIRVTALQLCRCGQLLRQEGEEELAEKSYERAIMVDAQSLLALKSYQRLLEDRGAVEEAAGLGLCAESVLDVVLSALEGSLPAGATREEIMECVVEQQEQESHRVPLPEGSEGAAVEEIAEEVWQGFKESTRRGEELEEEPGGALLKGSPAGHAQGT